MSGLVKCQDVSRQPGQPKRSLCTLQVLATCGHCPTAVLGSGPLVAASCSQQVLATCGHCPCGSPWILPTCRCILQPAATLYCGPCHLATARQCSSSPVFRCSPLLHIIFSTTYLQDSTSAPPGVGPQRHLLCNTNQVIIEVITSFNEREHIQLER